MRIVGRDRRLQDVVVVVEVAWRDRGVGKSCMRGCDCHLSREASRKFRNRWVGCSHRKLGSEPNGGSDWEGDVDC